VAVRRPVPASLEVLPEIRAVDALASAAEPTPRCALLFGDDLNALVVEHLLPAWQAEVRFLTSMTGQGIPILTLTSRQADKGVALAVACADIGINAGDVVAMGDSETDIEMFRVAGASVAMGQASGVVRDAATWVTTGHDDDGVGRAIEDLLAGRR
jgi:hydroxymethylpyrimidine pyrophosphatase-like HAD family hydrolase